MKVVIAIYSHPEFYPPTINVAEALSDADHEVTILCSNNAKEISTYARSINLVTVGNFIYIRAMGQRSTFAKAMHWLSYTWHMRKLLKGSEIIVLYDPIPLLSYRIAAFFLNKKPRIIWYHNHDIMEIAQQRKYSISWWASKNEPLMFPDLDIFSLPAEERKAHFPMDKLKGHYVFLPNFPSLRRYGSESSIKSDTEWRIIFQGSIGPGHGIEEICNLLPMEYQGRPIRLLLKGFVSDEFKNKINAILTYRRAFTSVEWIGITKYEALSLLTSSCHIGIAIFAGSDVMNQTLGTASNKIYEYAACGLPILYFEDKHYNLYLDKYPWAFATDLKEESLLYAIEQICIDYHSLSALAKKDFLKDLNFEKNFVPITNYLNQLALSR